jgi:hypothetical protein
MPAGVIMARLSGGCTHYTGKAWVIDCFFIFIFIFEKPILYFRKKKNFLLVRLITLPYTLIRKEDDPNSRRYMGWELGDGS